MIRFRCLSCDWVGPFPKHNHFKKGYSDVVIPVCPVCGGEVKEVDNAKD